MEKMQLERLIAGYLSGNLAGAEKERLLAWVEASDENRAYFEEMVAVWSVTAQYEVEEVEWEVDAAWNKVSGAIQPKASPEEKAPSDEKIIRLSNRRSWLRVAAVLLLAVMAGYWLMNLPADEQDPVVTILTGEDEERAVALPDGSQIWLNERSELSYREGFHPREVQLKGEAFFDVERIEDRPFVILSGGARTEVLGTSFNIRAYPGETNVEVTVETGTVAFSKAAKAAEEPVILEAGSSALLKKTEKVIEKKATKINNAASWHTQTLTFESQRFEELEQSLERYFDIEIQFENDQLLNCVFTGTFKQPQIEDVLRPLKFIHNLNVRQEGTTYFISGQGCD
jgi:transmembrane sensor